MALKKLLLHSCCGPCSSACIERLADEFEVTVYYSNSCIDDEDEYRKRLKNQIQFINEYNKRNNGNIHFVEGDYDPEHYHELVKGLEEEPEGGARCPVCFRMRLAESAEYASEHGFDAFTTTLTVSPHKNYALISQIGSEVGKEAGIEYLPYDFKKKDGFLRSIQLSKEYGLYRQDYCGCNYSRRKKGGI